MGRSIVQAEMDSCFLCGSRRWLEVHHVFFGAYRAKAEKYGLTVCLCHSCHNEPPNGVHQNRERRIALQQYVQAVAMNKYGWSTEDFIREFGKNYL